METGHEIWTSSWKADFQESMGGPGPRATPTWYEGKLYALGAEGELRCFEANTGEVLWSKNILRDNQTANLKWAMAASPLLVDDKVIVLPGGRSDNSVVAYHKLTGESIWKSLSDKQAYTSPMLVTLAGQRQLLIVSAERAMGLRVDDGSLLWDYPWKTSFDVNAAQPIVVGENRFYISAGYDHGAALVRVTREESRFAAHTVWETNRMKNKFSGAVLHEGHVYGLDEAILACIEVDSGRLKWKGGRYGYGQLLLASGHLIIITEKGELVLVKATPDEHEELARFSAVTGKTWNNPAIAGGRLLVRNSREMVCFRIAP
jgi:outer membrane protein assembly factor BamB